MANENVGTAFIQLQFDFNQAQAEAKATQAGAAAGAAFQRGFARVQGRFASQAQQLEAAKSIDKAFGGIANRINFATQEAKSFGSAIASAASATKGLGIGFAIVSAAVGAAAIKIGKSFAETAGNFQALRQSLDAIIKNSATANTTTDRFVKSLRNLAVQSGRSSAILANTGRQFLALGFSGDKAIEVLTTFTKAASLTGASNEQLRLALNGVAQIASKGAVAMEELRRQIAENLPGAINLSRFFEILGESMGVTAEEARKLQEQGKITAEQGIPALIATINEAIGDIDVFALRLNTLSGAVGAIREVFTQAVEDGFQPFIKALLGTKEAAGPLREALTGIQKGGADLRALIERLGTTLGTSFAEVLRQIIPLLPQLANLFVTLVEAIGPVFVEIVKISSQIAQVLLPALNGLATAFDVLVNDLGPLSIAFKALTAALLVAGTVFAFQSLGKAVLSSTGLIGSLGRAVITLTGSLPGLTAAVATLRGGLAALTASPILPILATIAAGIAVIKGIETGIDRVKKEGGLKNAILGGGPREEETLNRLFGPGGTLLQASDSIQSVEDAVKKAADTIKPRLTEINAALTTFVDKLKTLEDAAGKVAEAQKGLTDANQALTKATENLKELEKERSKILADNARDVRELAEAEEDLTRIRFKLRDLDQEEADILAELAELRTPASARDLAAADRDIERATIALNKAKKEEAALLRGLNEEQKTSVNLEGLSLDQIRAKLANIRATNAARKKEESGEKSLEEQQTEARLNVADAEETLNKAKEARNILDDKVKNNAIAIRELEERLVTLSIDRAAALRDEGVAQDALNTLRSGETARAIELREIDKEIKTAKEGQKAAEEGVRDAAIELREVEREQAELIAEEKGDQETINKLLLERIGLNRTLIAQSPELRAQAVSDLTDLIFKAIGGEAFGFTDIESSIADALLNNPNALLDILRRFGLKAAEGAVVTKPGIWNLGEGYRPEVVLPLTKPDRVWSLLSQTLPKYPGALAAAQQAIQPNVRPLAVQLPRGSGGNRPGAGPMTADQADEIIRLLKANGKSQVTVEAPVQIMSPVQDADALARKVAQRVERTLARGL
jgi:tape measure domain-containing protein